MRQRDYHMPVNRKKLKALANGEEKKTYKPIFIIFHVIVRECGMECMFFFFFEKHETNSDKESTQKNSV